MDCIMSELASPHPLNFRESGRCAAYGFYVIGDAMAPRFEPGWLLLVNPRRMIKRGDNVLLQTKNHADCNRPHSYIAIFDAWTAEELVVLQLKEGRTLRWPKADVIAMHHIVGVADL